MKQYVSKERKAFYNSALWRRCRESYLKKKKYLCERCLKQGIISYADHVHHKTYITDENLYNTEISLDENNLEALCVSCHSKEHKKSSKRRYFWTKDGRCTPL